MASVSSGVKADGALGWRIRCFFGCMERFRRQQPCYPKARSVMALAALRQQLDQLIVPVGRDSPALSTGIPALDRSLIRGIPRRRLTEISGSMGSGRATLLRRLVGETLRLGLWVAYVDASRTLSARDWSEVRDSPQHSSSTAELWFVRPHDYRRGAWCADQLLQCGCFSLVVLDGAPTLARKQVLRLLSRARDSDAALIVVSGEAGGSMLRGAVRLKLGVNAGTRERRNVGTEEQLLRCANDRGRRREIIVEKGGQRTRVGVNYEIGVTHRLCAHPTVPDRRGAEWHEGARTGGPACPERSEGANRPTVRTFPRKRRCAEAVFG